MYRYLVHYHQVSFTPSFLGGPTPSVAEVGREQPIRGMDDVREVEEALKVEGAVDPKVLAFSRFDDPEEA